MPLYEYRCRKCGVQIEKIQKFSDPLLTTCEQCGGELEQLLSAPAIQFKGSGFYITDYGKSGASNKAPADRAVSEKAADDKSDKAAAKSEGSPSSDSPKPAPASSRG